MATRNLEGEFDVFKDDLNKLRNDLAHLSAALRDTTSETVREQVDAIRTHVDKLTREAREQGRETLDDLADRIEERPLTSVLIAFGVGVLLGRLLDR